MRSIRIRLVVATVSALGVAATVAWLLRGAGPPPPPLVVALDMLPIDHPAVDYFDDAHDNPVVTLNARLAAGTATLAHEPQLGYLTSVLERLAIDVRSQVLVFSKTSLQHARISPAVPRAIYFNDDVAVGYVPGTDALELAAVDAVGGVQFYELPTRPMLTGTSPRFARAVCLGCHHGPATRGVPGLYVGSVATGPGGQTVTGRASDITDHRTPFAERWGGWYVDGAPFAHRGNRVTLAPTRAVTATRPAPRAEASDRFPVATSDVVALMTLEHQTQLTNLLTRLRWEHRIATAAGRPLDRLAPLVAETVRALLFVDEAPLPAPIDAGSPFAVAFMARGPRDPRGRSLRDFDLVTRLFRHPLSYMIHSRAFGTLPEAVRDRVYRQLHDVLVGDDPAQVAGHLTADERAAIVEIVTATQDALPAWWPRR